jgi:hypothetical protein
VSGTLFTLLRAKPEEIPEAAEPGRQSYPELSSGEPSLAHLRNKLDGPRYRF